MLKGGNVDSAVNYDNRLPPKAFAKCDLEACLIQSSVWLGFKFKFSWCFLNVSEQ